MPLPWGSGRIGMKLPVGLWASVIAASPAPPATYILTKSTTLGTPDRWDYVVYDDHMDRIYVAHGDRLEVIDARTASVVGEVQGITGGTHGTAVSSSTGQGFTDDGR